MSIQLSVAVRNARLDALEATVGVSPTLEIRTGVVPVSCAAADSGTVIATLALPSDWMAAAAGGAKALTGTWQDASADASGVAGHWRIKAGGGTCHLQGTCSMAGGGGDMILDNTNLAAGQQFTITSFVLTEANS